jgi:hypothetical protein
MSAMRTTILKNFGSKYYDQDLLPEFEKNCGSESEKNEFGSTTLSARIKWIPVPVIFLLMILIDYRTR